MRIPILLHRKKNYSLFHKTSDSTGLQHLRLNWLVTCPDKNSLPKSHLEVTPPSLSQVDSQQNSNRFQSKRALLTSAVTLELDEGRFDQKEVNISLDKLQSFTSPIFFRPRWAASQRMFHL